ncbi:hypothetical protein Agabi119p4_4981 [Agaricus bisporus var. burnettii]|uniref:Uncharacterized protein n=1 Tax=Agaricus bisporus var. burnettii TaxID=192524 RepID=A0A8H7F4H5_AGABI|nr:hypothetical protein Agabi119p4_4981 [Agaricus bisporus var. burnettii]
MSAPATPTPSATPPASPSPTDSTTTPGTTTPPPPSTDPPSSPPPTSPPPTTSDTPPPSTSDPPPSTDPSQPPPSTPSDSSTSTSSQSTLSLTDSATYTPTTSVTDSVVVSTTNGQAFTTTVQVTTIFSAPAVITAPPNGTDNNQGGGGSNHTGAIVGGVVGGVVGGLAILALLVWIILRKRRQAKFDEFDGNFDPARVVSSRGNRLNLDDEDTPAAAGITPYPYPEHQQQNMAQVPFGAGYVPSSSTSASPPPQLPPGASYSQHYNPTSPASDGGYTTTSSGHLYPSPGNMNAVAAAAFLGRGGPSPGSSVNIPPSEMGSSGSHSGHGNSGSGGTGYYNTFGNAAGRMSNKEREAYEAAGPSGRMVVTNDEEQAYPQYPHNNNYNNMGPSASTTPRVGTPQQQQRGEKSQVNLDRATSPSVIVHQDGGRVPQLDDHEEETGAEIPPTYDSIPRDQR